MSTSDTRQRAIAALSQLERRLDRIQKHPGHADQKVHGRRSGNGGGGGRPGMGDGVPLPMDKIAAGPGHHSLANHIGPDGKLTPERQALHDQIVESHFNGITKSDDPTMYMMGGGPAAGKSTFIENPQFSVIKNRANTAEINSDDIKQRLPEASTRGADWAAFTHAESSYLSDRVIKAAAERGVDHLLDGTGDHGIGELTNRVSHAKKAGMRVEAVYVTVPTNVAVQRSNARAEQTGRVVPEAVIRGTHRGVSEVFPQALQANTFDRVQLWDTAQGAAPVLLGEKPTGGSWTVNQQSGYNAFLAKAGE